MLVIQKLGDPSPLKVEHTQLLPSQLLAGLGFSVETRAVPKRKPQCKYPPISIGIYLTFLLTANAAFSLTIKGTADTGISTNRAPTLWRQYFHGVGKGCASCFLRYVWAALILAKCDRCRLMYKCALPVECKKKSGPVYWPFKEHFGNLAQCAADYRLSNLLFDACRCNIFSLVIARP